MDRLHAIAHGRVQGVNFRADTQREAERLDIRGWVRNNLDGTVEVVAEGPRPSLERLAAFLRQGPPTASVETVDLDWHEATGEFDYFRIRH